jgi:hypothetical protein
LQVIYTNIKSLKTTELINFPKELKQSAEDITNLLDQIVLAMNPKPVDAAATNSKPVGQAAVAAKPKFKDFTGIP